MTSTANPAGEPKLTNVKITPSTSEPTERDDRPAEFERFEALTGKLAQVSKGELDGKREAT